MAGSAAARGPSATKAASLIATASNVWLSADAPHPQHVHEQRLLGIHAAALREHGKPPLIILLHGIGKGAR